MRMAMLAAPGVGPILGTVSLGVGTGIHGLRMLAFDRAENGDAFPGERVVRLPRGLSRRRAWETPGAALARVRREICG